MMSSADRDMSSNRSPYPEPVVQSPTTRSVPDNNSFGLAGFDIFKWHSDMEASRRYFLDHGQHNPQIQTLAAFINIRLPFQWHLRRVSSSTSRTQPISVRSSSSPGTSRSEHHDSGDPRTVSLLPYMRRLIATAFDTPQVLQGLFGDNWQAGVGAMHEMERRNYLFACKSSSWLKVKNDYDMDEDQRIPFLQSLLQPSEDEIKAAETAWSEWLAMQDWMVGPRAPPTHDEIHQDENGVHADVRVSDEPMQTS